MLPLYPLKFLSFSIIPLIPHVPLPFLNLADIDGFLINPFW